MSKRVVPVKVEETVTLEQVAPVIVEEIKALEHVAPVIVEETKVQAQPDGFSIYEPVGHRANQPYCNRSTCRNEPSRTCRMA